MIRVSDLLWERLVQLNNRRVKASHTAVIRSLEAAAIISGATPGRFLTNSGNGQLSKTKGGEGQTFEGKLSEVRGETGVPDEVWH